LSNKVYLPPSAYETCFISTAHDSDIMESAIESLCDALKKI
jgi:glutamate-1-semialdehyde 2,1-aminomutase